MRLVEMPVLGLKPGMFVAELDRPWLDTPFSLQGFVVRDDHDIEFVSKHVDHVYVDADYQGGNIHLLDMANSAEQSKDQVPLKLKADFQQARVCFESASATLDRVFEGLQSGGQVDVVQVKSAVRPLIDGVFKNKDAVAALARLKESGEYRYNHGIAMSVWAAIMGRHVGLHKDELEKLVVGCAMCDVGMSALPAELLNQSDRLTEEQRAEVQRHTEVGAAILGRSENVDLEVLMIIENHHERHDGSGYPQKLSGAEIPLLARIAGLVDTYDAMISHRPHAQGRSSFEAVQELLDSKQSLFQGALVEQFVQAVGLFPVGSLVELNSGEVAIVTNQNLTRRLKPEVLVVLGADKSASDQQDLLDLACCPVLGDDARWIVRELPYGAHGIRSQDYFI